MLCSQRYLTSFVILLLGLMQGVSAHTKLVTGFLHRPVCLVVEVNMDDSRSTQTIIWQRGSQHIVQYQKASNASAKIFPKYEGRVTYDPENNSLVIHQLSLQDEGHYMITITPSSGLEVRTFINLTVLVPVSEPRITVRTEGAPHPMLIMNCTVENGSDPQVSWMKDNKILVSGQQFRPLINYRSFRVANVTSSDCGTYTCIVQNPVNRVEAPQLITDEHFQECLHRPALGMGQALSITVAVLCAVGFLAVFIVIKKYKGRRRVVNGDGPLNN
uniref:hepatic and glial cell adhesion molecule-like n=1 Tax=Pristiophorus japonicus TaxID=55135 RepID=UPI00398F0A90